MDIQVDDEVYMPKMNEVWLADMFGDTKISFIMLLIFVVCIYVAIFMILGNSGLSSNNYGTNMIVLCLEIILWLVLIYVVYINIKNHDEKTYDFEAKMENLFNTKISELSVNAKNEVKTKDVEPESECGHDKDAGKEVFHVAGNDFTYEEARDMCETYNARLANYTEIENAYRNGANWCSYGWSRDQLALFPTQKSLYNELKLIPGHENDCGRPGINGGFFKNKYIKFGANCYGVKPKPRKKDEDYTHALNHSPALSEEEMKENNIHNKYIIAPFNKDKWTNV